MVYDVISRLIQECDSDETACFPPTLIHNEGWMLRLVLNALETHRDIDLPFKFLDGARWYSEARLASPFAPRVRQDKQGEGFTNADAVVGHFSMRSATKAGLELRDDAKQFVVLEAKMYSNLSAGTKNAATYNQAARNVACMANALRQKRIAINDLASVGFYVLAPEKSLRHETTNLERFTHVDTIRSAIRDRVTAYNSEPHPYPDGNAPWASDDFTALVDRLEQRDALKVVSWEECIEAIAKSAPKYGAALAHFYDRCKSHGARSLAPME